MPDFNLRFITDRLHDRRFITTGNDHGVSDARTVFHYRVDGAVVSGTYQGGQIRTGQVLGNIVGADQLELLYHCVTTQGELLAGWSRGTVQVDDRGQTLLDFHWGWLSGAEGGGTSSYVEETP